MYQCPSCHQETVTLLRKWLSWPSRPAHCPLCGGLCLVPRSNQQGITIVVVIFMALCGLVAGVLQSVVLFLIGVLAALGFHFWRMHGAALERIAPEVVAEAKKNDAITIAISMLPWPFL